MKKSFLIFCSFILFFFVASISGATTINGSGEVSEISPGAYAIPDGYVEIASQPIDLDHYRYYTWGIEDLKSTVDLSGGVDIVFHEIYNWKIEANWLNVYLFNEPTTLGWEIHRDNQDTDLPDWETEFSATHLGTWSYETETMDVVFHISDPVLLAYMQDGNSFGIGIDPDCHYWGGEITVNAPVPEPATMFLFGSGLIGLAGYRRKLFK